MLVSGTISVSPQGSVTTFSLDKFDKLPTSVVQMLGKSIPHWRFEPVFRDCKPVAATAAMRLRVVAKPIKGDAYSVGIAGTHFGTYVSKKSNDSVTSKRRPPKYPLALKRAGVSGTVYLLVRVDRQGYVAKVAAKQVNLMTRGRPRQMEQWRHLLADSATNAARQWTLEWSTSGGQVNADHLDRQIYVTYQISSDSDAKPPDNYGRWIAYLPGPPQDIPWADPSNSVGDDIDVLPTGTLLTAEQRLHRIVTP